MFSIGASAIIQWSTSPGSLIENQRNRPTRPPMLARSASLDSGERPGRDRIARLQHGLQRPAPARAEGLSPEMVLRQRLEADPSLVNPGYNPHDSGLVNRAARILANALFMPGALLFRLFCRPSTHWKRTIRPTARIARTPFCNRCSQARPVFSTQCFGCVRPKST